MGPMSPLTNWRCSIKCGYLNVFLFNYGWTQVCVLSQIALQLVAEDDTLDTFTGLRPIGQGESLEF